MKLTDFRQVDGKIQADADGLASRFEVVDRELRFDAFVHFFRRRAVEVDRSILREVLQRLIFLVDGNSVRRVVFVDGSGVLVVNSENIVVAVFVLPDASSASVVRMTELRILLRARIEVVVVSQL